MPINDSKRAQKKFENLIEHALETMTENPKLPGGIPTLIDIPERKPLPAPPKGQCILAALVDECPRTYEEFLTALKKGSFWKGAAASVGLSVGTVRRWGQRGKEDAEAELDTYYSRFYLDVLKAIGQCRCSVEQALAKIQPWKWLSHGPGSVFGTEWTDAPLDEKTAECAFIPEPDEVIERISGVEVEMVRLDAITEEAAKVELDKALRNNRKGAKDAGTE